MAKHTLTCCPICEQPIEIHGDWLKLEKKYVEKTGFSIKVVHSNRGWGFAQCDVEFSNEVCVDCYRTVAEMLRPAIEFIRGVGRRGDPVSSVLGEKPQQNGRGKSLLRLLSPNHK